MNQSVFEKIVDFKIFVPDDMKLFKILVIFVFESINLQNNSLQDTEATKCVGRHIPVSVPITSNLLGEPIFLCNEKPLTLIREFLQELQSLARRNSKLNQEKFATYLEKLRRKNKNVLLEIQRQDPLTSENDFVMVNSD